jgi:hypothetical protein
MQWQNKAYNALYEDMDIMVFIRVGRLKSDGHVVRTDQQRHVAEKRGRPKVRREDGVDNDVKALGERKWINTAKNRQAWQNLLRKAMAQKGLF